MRRRDFVGSAGAAAITAAVFGAAPPAAHAAAGTGPTFDPGAYGAAYDGITDDSAALQAAFDACVAAGGGTVLITGYLKIGRQVTVRQGRPSSCIRLTGHGSRSRLIPAVPD